MVQRTKPRTHLEYDVELPGNRRVKILGITHGQMPIAPLGPHTSDIILQRVGKNPEAQIYAEGDTKPASLGMVPRSLAHKALPLESPWTKLQFQAAIRNLPFSTLLKVVSLATAGALFNWTRDAAGFPEAIPKNLGKLSMRREKAKGSKLFSEKEAREFYHFS